MKKFLMVALAAAMFAACGDKEEAPKTLELAGGGTTQEQTFYKDEVEEQGGFAFYAPAPWTAEVNYSTASRAANDGWLRLKLNGVEATSGPAGNMTLTIEMDANDTDVTRSAEIVIDCGGSKITVKVTQDARTIEEAGDDYKPRPEVPKLPDDPKPQPNPLIAHPWQHISTTIEPLDGPYVGKDDVYAGDYTLTFNANGTVALAGTDQDEFTKLFGTTLPTYTFTGSKLIWHLDLAGEGSNYPLDAPFDVVTLTDNDLVLTLTSPVTWEDSNGKTGVYNQKVTVKFTKSGSLNPPPAARQVELDAQALSLAVSETYILKEINGMAVTFESSNSKIVSVGPHPDGAGYPHACQLTAMGEGKATITATSADGKSTASCVVTVTAEGVKPDKSLITAHPWRHVVSSYEYTEPAGKYDFSDKEPYTATFSASGTITGGVLGGALWSVDGNNLTISFAADKTSVTFKILKLTDAEFEFTAYGLEEPWEDADGNSGVNVFNMTMKFEK
jgi:hypothetical protein